jgi:hypothetical protein
LRERTYSTFAVSTGGKKSGTPSQKPSGITSTDSTRPNTPQGTPVKQKIKQPVGLSNLSTAGPSQPRRDPPQSQLQADMVAMNIVAESGPDEDEGPPPAVALAKEALLEEVKKKLGGAGQKKAVSLVIIGKFDRLVRVIRSCLISV